MSLLVDPNFLLQQLRLDFLTNIPDPLGPGTITFPDESAPYVSLAQLDDPELWPELREVRSPDPTPAAFTHLQARHRARGKLQYSETIGPSGAGIRVSGRKASIKGRRGGDKSASTTPRAVAGPPVNSVSASPEKEGKRAHRRSKQYSSHHGNVAPAGQLLDPEADSEEDTGFIDVKGKGKAVDMELTFDDAEDDAEDEATEGDDMPEPLSPLPEEDSLEMGREQAFQRPGPPPKHQQLGSHLGNPHNPPLVKIDSPETLMTSEGISDTGAEVSTARSESEEDRDYQELPPMKRPQTLTLASSFSHDQELSEALRLNDGAISVDPTSMLDNEFSGSDDPNTGVTHATDGGTSDDNNMTTGMTVSSADEDFSFVKNGFDKSFVPSAMLPAVAEHGDERKDDQSARGEPDPQKLAPPTVFRPRERRRVNISLRAPLQLPMLQANVESTTSSSLSPTKVPSQRGRARTNSSEKVARTAGGSGSNRPKPSMPPLTAGSAAVPIAMPSEDDGAVRRSKVCGKDNLETFPICKMEIAKRTTGPSALSTMMAQAIVPQSHNPYTSMYGALASQSGDSLKLNLFFPHSRHPTKKLIVSIRKDVTVEEVVGFGLWSYWQSKREPPLGPEDADGLTGKMEATAWNLRMAEEDGEVDDDFPALDRLQPIAKVGAKDFGIVEATEAQAAANRALLAQITRRPSRFVAPVVRVQPPKGSSSAVRPPPSQQTEVSGADADVVASSMVEPASRRPTDNVSGEPTVPLRIRAPAKATGDETVLLSVKVRSTMYLQDVLELVCRRRSDTLTDHRNFALLLGGQDTVVPLDRTVESLQGMFYLRLVRRSEHVALLASAAKTSALRNVNPAAPITKRLSEPMAPRYVSAVDVMAPYKEWVVTRKHAMSLTRHDRLFVVDGEYVTIRSMSTGRTHSHHIANVVECRASKRVPGSFKFTVVLPSRDLKRFDFDANSAESVNEIITAVKTMSQTFKNSKMVK